jgi:hypothetical protein
MCKTNGRHETKNIILHKVMQSAHSQTHRWQRRKGTRLTHFLLQWRHSQELADYSHYSNVLPIIPGCKKVPYYSKRNSGIMCVSLIIA